MARAIVAARANVGKNRATTKAIGRAGFVALAAVALWAPEVFAVSSALFAYAADTYLMIHLDMESVRLASF